MTVKELYEWAVKNNAENFDIEIGIIGDSFFDGYVRDCNEPEVTTREHEYHTEEKVVYL